MTMMESQASVAGAAAASAAWLDLVVLFLHGSAPKGYCPFVKMQGLENYFVLVDQRHCASVPTAADAIRICNPCIGVGAEQLLVLHEPSPDGRAKGAYAALTIFNIDGRIAGACGNATRCVASLLLHEASRDRIGIETDAGVLECARAQAASVSVWLGPIRAGWEAIPLAHAADTARLPVVSGPLKNGMALSIGNPHAVFFVERFDVDALVRWAPAVQSDPLFPEGVNVGMAQVVDHRTLRLAVWERPGMLTRACGTGACVAAFAAHRRGLINSRDVEVHLPAGVLNIELHDDDTAVMTGPVAYCCHGFVCIGTGLDCDYRDLALDRTGDCP